MKAFAMVGAALLLAGCGGGGSGANPDDAKKDEAPPASLAGGEYEVTSELVTLASTDNSTPATKMKQGDKFSVKACVAKDGTPDPALFAEPGDQCESTSSYISNGRMSVQLKCTRAGVSGQIMPTFDGKYTADGFTGDGQSLTYFVAEGDYRTSTKVEAKRIGDCPAAPAAEPAKS